MPLSTPVAPRRQWAASLGFTLDLVILVAFIAQGRQTHEGTGWAGFLEALRPFLIALLLAWVAVLAWRAFTDSRTGSAGSAPVARGRAAHSVLGLWPVGIGIWLFTAVGGLALRAFMGGGVSGMFPLVAIGTLGAGMLGWRLVAMLLGRRNKLPS